MRFPSLSLYSIIVIISASAGAAPVVLVSENFADGVVGPTPPASNWALVATSGPQAGSAFATACGLATTYDHDNDPLTPKIDIPGGIEVSGGSGRLGITVDQPAVFDPPPNNYVTLSFWAARRGTGTAPSYAGQMVSPNGILVMPVTTVQFAANPAEWRFNSIRVPRAENSGGATFSMNFFGGNNAPSDLCLTGIRCVANDTDPGATVLTGTNPAAIAIPDRGPGSPYPTSITVPGGLGEVTDVNVTLRGWTHSYPADVDMLLVAPNGRTVLLVSDAGGSLEVSNVTLTLDDEAAAPLPTGQITSGTFKPSNFGGGGDTFAPDAPPGPYGSALSVLRGLDPHGTWRLYVMDNQGGDEGQISGGWELTLTAFKSTYTVTSTADPGDGVITAPGTGDGTTLREAITAANGDGIDSTISFDHSVFSAPRKTIALDGTALPAVIGNARFTITAPPAGVAVSGSNVSRILQVENGAVASLLGLTLTGGNPHSSQTLGIGGAILNYGNLLLDACTLSGNFAVAAGAIYSSTNLSGSRTLTLRNCTLSGNSVTQSAGALYNEAGLISIESCTITGNAASAGLGGVVSSGSTSNTRTVVRNSIIAGNVGTDVDRGASNNTFQSDGYNLIGDGNAASEFVEPGDVAGNSVPGLAALADEGGRTRTHALLLTSPARNTGDSLLATDQRGIARPQDLRDDKGAYELAVNESLFVTTLIDENNGTSDPGFGTGTSLREAVAFANSDGVDSTINFSLTVFAAPRKTITLAGTPLDLLNNGELDILGPTAGVIVSGNNASRVFTVAAAADVLLSRVTVTGGNGVGAIESGSGGGILVKGGLFLQESHVTGNTASGVGGGVCNSGGQLDVLFSTISNNVSTSTNANGGGIFNTGALVVVNSTISGNSAVNGIPSAGGIYTRTQAATISHSTITNNAAGSAGSVGGLYASGATATLNHTIVAANQSNNIRADIAGPIGSSGYNLIGNRGNVTLLNAGDQAGTAAAVLDPRLSALAAHGGLTPTHALLLGSPALNTGGPTSQSIDQRQLPRIFGTAVDKGAYELQPETYALWVSYTFPSGTSFSVTQSTADPDADGIPNAIERATGRNPLSANAPGSVLDYEVDGDFLVLEFERSITVDPALVFVQQSLDLQIWNSAGISYQNVGSAGPATELIRAFIPINGAPRKFGRLAY